MPNLTVLVGVQIDDLYVVQLAANIVYSLYKIYTICSQIARS